MLFRFLGFATMSVTFLTIQAINSSEIKSQLPPLTYEVSSDVIILEQGYEQNTISARQYKKLQPSLKITDPFTSQISTHNPIAPKIILASFGEISLILPEVNTKKHHTYLPPIDFDIAPLQTGETSPSFYAPKPRQAAKTAEIITAALTSTSIIKNNPHQNIEPAKVKNTPRKKYGVKKSKRYKKKYARTKHKKWKSAGKRKTSSQKKYSKNRGWKRAKYMTAFN